MGIRIVRSENQRDPERDQKEGRRLRIIGTEQAKAHALPWHERAVLWIESRRVGRQFTSEDLTDAIGLPRRVGTNRNNAVGSAMQTASRRRIIKRIGYTTATRKESHGRALAVWERI